MIYTGPIAVGMMFDTATEIGCIVDRVVSPGVFMALDSNGNFRMFTRSMIAAV